MSELLDAAIKAGDKIYFRGEKVESIEITRDKDEPPLKVDLAHTRASYLDTITEQLNENQQKYLKQLQYNHERLGNTHDALFFGLVDYEKRWNFNDEDFAQVLQIFSQWALEQEEE